MKNENKLKLYIDKYKKYLTNYKTVKTSLQKIVKHKESILKINEAVIHINKIIIHTYQFIKLYYLEKYHNGKQLPEIDKNFINSIMKILCTEDPRGAKGNQENIDLKKELFMFYVNNYSHLIEYEHLEYTHLNTVLDYESISLLTCFKNHISEHYVQFLNRYINVMTEKNKYLQYIKEAKCSSELRKEMKRVHMKELWMLKKDIIDNTDECLNKYNGLKKYIRKNIIPIQINIKKQLNDNPLMFLKSMIKMSIEIEKREEKTFNCFPLRKNIIPKYIRLDTTTIVHFLFGKDINKSHYLKKGNTKLLEYDIWDAIFNINKNVFKDKKYSFNHQIETDGIACSLLFIRNDLYDPLKVVRIHTMKKPNNYKSDKYVEELTQAEKYNLWDYNIIGIDPGKEDLIYATNGNTQIIDGKHKTPTFRYSQNQRRKETRSKKYMKIIDNDKKNTIIQKSDKLPRFLELLGMEQNIHANKSVKELETHLSECNAKSCVLKNVKKYIKNKSTINCMLYEYYAKDLYRKLKWYAFINRQRSEANMINEFKKFFGDEKKNIICIGDYDNHNMKYKEPTKGKSFRKLFKNSGYKLFLVNEYNTSKTSFLEGKLTEKFRKRGNPRPFKTDVHDVHGLLRFKSVHANTPSTEILVNRDFNGAMNILKKAVCILNNINLPKNLTRKK